MENNSYVIFFYLNFIAFNSMEECVISVHLMSPSMTAKMSDFQKVL